jgi:NTE family protein
VPTALVLGAGGVVGMAYHAGVLRALELEAGFVPSSADLIVGTSAGSVVGGYLRRGWTTEDFWQLAHGQHPRMPALDDGSNSVMERAFRTPLGLLRRGIGSAFVMGQSVARIPVGSIPSALQRAFPGSMFSMREARARLGEELGTEWPSESLWLCAVDILSGRRVVLGREGSPTLDLTSAVQASCAIPGIYKPVRAGGKTLVDGGAHSTTNLDLAAQFGAELIVCVAPMAFDTSERLPDPVQRMVRMFPARKLSSEVAEARRAGAEVLMLRPSAADLRIQGLNMMRPAGMELVARAAYESTARALQTDRFKSLLPTPSAS